MPALLSKLGISRWVLTPHLRMNEGRARTVAPVAWLRGWFREFEVAAQDRGIRCHINDEFGFFEKELETLSTMDPWPPLNTKRVFDPRFLFRIDPLGYVRNGARILEPWTPSGPRWNPERDNAVDVVGYWSLVQRSRSGETTHSQKAPTPVLDVLS